MALSYASTSVFFRRHNTRPSCPISRNLHFPRAASAHIISSRKPSILHSKVAWGAWGGQLLRRTVTMKAVEETSEQEQLGDPLVPVEKVAAILDNVIQLNSVRYAIQLHPSLGDPHQWKVHCRDDGRFYWKCPSSWTKSIYVDRDFCDGVYMVVEESIEEVVENGCAEYLAHNAVGVQATRLQEEEWAGWKSETNSENHPKQRLIIRSLKDRTELQLEPYSDHFVCDDPQGVPIDAGGRFLLRQYYKVDMYHGGYYALYGVLDRLSGRLAVSSNLVDRSNGKTSEELDDMQAMACARALRYLDGKPDLS